MTCCNKAYIIIIVCRGNGSELNNPTYSSDPRTQYRNKDDATLPEYQEHVYDAIRHPSVKENKKEVNGKAACQNYYDTPQIPSKNDVDADCISIKSDDVRYDDTEEQCTSSVKENKAYYSKMVNQNLSLNQDTVENQPPIPMLQ